jgi:NAD(P)H dehydrogenase (quinone)
MTIVGLNYGFAGQMKLDEVTGGRPTAPPRSPAATAAASRARTNSPGRAIRGARSQRTANKLHG